MPSRFSMWDVAEEDPRIFERNPETRPSAPNSGTYTFDKDVLIPRPDLGPNSYTFIARGTPAPVELFALSGHLVTHVPR